VGRLDDKIAVVTGGANGIGRACCERFAEEGANVVVADLGADAGGETVALVEKAGRNAVYVACDAASEADNAALMQRAVDEFGGVDILVTAAGITHAAYESGNVQRELEMFGGLGDLLLDPARMFSELPMDHWHKVLDVNLTGTYLALRAAVEPMRARGGGSIVTIASIAAKQPEAGPAAYAVSKAGVWMLTKQAARALAGIGVRVNAVGPGFIETNMTDILRQTGIFDPLIATVPMQRWGTAREVANTVLFLASDEASYFTGELLHPDGGFYTD
jgi:NAD(P)-dependent dehydrogenase (short-subunit alcohol dehydrogenase family)